MATSNVGRNEVIAVASHLPLLAISVLAIVPLAVADSQIYVGPGRVSVGGTSQTLIVSCDPGIGVGVGGGCEFPCASSCFVNVTDLLGRAQPYRICSWDGAHQRDCVDATDEMDYVSSADLVDVFVVNGVAGRVTVE